MSKVLIAMIHLYQHWLSPLLGKNCRFEPSCSQYAIDAMRAHGAILGTVYAMWRILRCQPLSRGGYDPVPQRRA
jgi:uncharacterized protein